MMRNYLSIYPVVVACFLQSAVADNIASPTNLAAAQPANLATARPEASPSEFSNTNETVIQPLGVKPQEQQQPDKTLSEFLHNIEQLESEKGPYDAQLSEQLEGLGVSYQQHGNHAEAIEAFKRAMHIHRIHEGLYNMNQAPIFERLIESHIALGEWDEANDRHQYLYWLNRRNFGQNDPRMLPIIDKLGSWHLNAFTLKGGGYADHLINANNLYKMAIEIIDEHYGETDLKLIHELRGITISNYYLASYTQQQSSKMPTFAMASSNNNSSEDQRNKLQQYVQNSYYTGKAAIDRMQTIYEENPEAPPGAAIKAQVELGDWYMLFNRSHSAINEYQAAYDKASHEGLSEQERNELFGHPRALPDMPMLQTKVINNNEPHDYVLVKFNVSSYGRATDIEILESHPEEDVRIRSRVRDSLKHAKFRPRLEDGKPVDTVNITQRYIFPK